MQITPAQLGRLQTLYGQLCAHEIGMNNSRPARLDWASERLQKNVTSFSDLSMDDAIFLIDSLQAQLGVKAPVKKRLNRAQARRAGLDGRRDGAEFAAAPQMATADDLGRIQEMIGQLGWDEAAFNKFMASSRNPLVRFSDKRINTTAKANKVWWALKRIAQSKGIWRKTT